MAVLSPVIDITNLDTGSTKGKSVRGQCTPANFMHAYTYANTTAEHK